MKLQYVTLHQILMLLYKIQTQKGQISLHKRKGILTFSNFPVSYVWIWRDKDTFPQMPAILRFTALKYTKNECGKPVLIEVSFYFK